MFVMQGLNNDQNQQPAPQHPPAQHQHDRSNEMNAVLSHLETLREVILEQQRTIRALGQELQAIRQQTAPSGPDQEVLRAFSQILEEANNHQQQHGRLSGPELRAANAKAKNLHEKLVRSSDDHET